MQIYLSSISGWDDAIMTLFMSKGTWTPDLDKKIHHVCDACFTRRGLLSENAPEEELETLDKWLCNLFKYGQKHITMLRFLDFCFVVQGLHRGGTDDWDAHAERFDNRIIRLSTRMNAMKNWVPESHDLPVSDYYKGKILTLGQVCNILGYELPETIKDPETDQTFVRRINGYVANGYKDNPDTMRGLYNLALDNLFVFKCNFTQYAHVRDLRSRKTLDHPDRGHAHPELWDLCDEIDNVLFTIHPAINEKMFDAIKQ